MRIRDSRRRFLKHGAAVGSGLLSRVVPTTGLGPARRGLPDRIRRHARPDHSNVERPWVNPDGSLAPEVDEMNDIVVQPLFGKPLRLKVPTGKGLHGGGDTLMLERLFAESDAADPYRHFADSRAGAYSIAVGVAANRSIASGVPVGIEEVLGTTFARPDYPVGATERNAPIDIAHYPFLAGAMAIEEGLV